MNDIVLNGIIGIISSVITWFLAKRRYNAEVGDVVIKNMEQSLQFYMKLSDDNRDRLNDLQTKLDSELNKNLLLKNELEVLKMQIQFLLRYNCMKMGCKHRITNSESNNENTEEIID